MKNIEVSVQITIKPTDASMRSDPVVTPVDDGHFRVVLKAESLFDIDALEQGMLQATYPTMRDALARALETATRDRATRECREKGGPTMLFDTPVTTELMAK